MRYKKMNFIQITKALEELSNISSNLQKIEWLKNHNDEDVRIMLDNFQLLCEEISEGLLLLYGVNLQK